MSEHLTQLTAEIVSAYLAHNRADKSDLGELISATYAALGRLGSPAEPEAEKPVPHMPVKKTITPDHLISLEDGKSYKSLKRHLSGRGMTPDEYRKKWSLSHDYPMVAPNYAKQRSELARTMGLGRKRKEEIKPAPKAPAKRGRPARAKAPAEAAA